MLEKGKKKLGQLESGSQKDGLTEGNAWGHCGEVSAKLTEFNAWLDQLLDLIVLVVWQGNHSMTQDKMTLCKHLETLYNDSSKERC